MAVLARLPASYADAQIGAIYMEAAAEPSRLLIIPTEALPDIKHAEGECKQSQNGRPRLGMIGSS